MRFAVTYQTDVLPLSYRMTVLSLVKEALRTADQTYFEELYEERNHLMKPFSYSVFLHDFTFQGDQIQLSSLTITFSSSDMEFMLHLFNGLQQLKTFQPGNYPWVQKQMRMVKETSITSSSAIFRTLSPILIESKDGKPVSPEEPNYAKEFQYYAHLKIREVFQREPLRPIEITAGSMKKMVIKESNQWLRQKEPSAKYLYFTAYQGRVRLQGHPDDLQLLYQTGVGKRSAQGFGLLELEREEG
ncbi:CRISPR-associated endoribonuclease Cas6 [Bacillaceae bacterium SIJ1]|uniref:CRISPR-associated endoribonuclease Cas6 n=1 Tax=Litoribacterium kuwaitense TaxID=1398745 RepID=UPI0013EA10E8|nr:CRISPR-associated endoribonuclease Cas6 [Litoribacterium kuwaitense]NGP44617.1 CRISPR-associated endoribonuclease Cas6 [Litoribacterium kuwaitense]